MGRVHGGIDLFAEQSGGVVVGALAALFAHHIEFGQDILVGENQILHAISFQLHHQLQPVAGDALEIGGVVTCREGIALAAIDVDQAVKLAGRRACSFP